MNECLFIGSEGVCIRRRAKTGDPTIKWITKKVSAIPMFPNVFNNGTETIVSIDPAHRLEHQGQVLIRDLGRISAVNICCTWLILDISLSPAIVYHSNEKIRGLILIYPNLLPSG